MSLECNLCYRVEKFPSDLRDKIGVLKSYFYGCAPTHKEIWNVMVPLDFLFIYLLKDVF